jgi:hypothetical protein
VVKEKEFQSIERLVPLGEVAETGPHQDDECGHVVNTVSLLLSCLQNNRFPDKKYSLDGIYFTPYLL